jgi:hypothetical protein
MTSQPDTVGDPVLLYVQATINMPGLRTFQCAWIDPSEPQFAPLLEARYLIPVDPPR